MRLAAEGAVLTPEARPAPNLRSPRALFNMCNMFADLSKLMICYCSYVQCNMFTSALNKAVESRGPAPESRGEAGGSPSISGPGNLHGADSRHVFEQSIYGSKTQKDIGLRPARGLDARRLLRAGRVPGQGLLRDPRAGMYAHVYTRIYVHVRTCMVSLNKLCHALVIRLHIT